MNKNQINILYDNENNIKGFSFPYYGESFVCKKNESFMECFKRARYKMLKKYGIDIENHFNEENVRKQPIEVKKANPELRKRIAAGVVLVAMAGASAFGVYKATSTPDKAYSDTKTEQSKDENINEENKQLKAIYKKLLKYEEGEDIIKYLQNIDKEQLQQNNRFLKTRDENNNALFYKAKELGSVHAIANGTNMNIPLLLPSDLVICEYLEACKVSTTGTYVTEQTSGFEDFIKDKETKEEYMTLVNPVQNLLDNKKGSEEEVKNAFAKLYQTPETYPEATSLSAYDGLLAVSGLEGAIDGDTVEKYQKETKTNNAILNYEMKYITNKEKQTKKSSEIYNLTMEAFEIMDEKNIKVNLKSRELFDASTTEKGKRMHNELLGGITINTDGTVTIRTKSSTVTRTMSKAEAERIFGPSAVKNAENKADEAAGIPEKNKQEEAKKEQLEQEASNYESEFKQGDIDGYNGAPKAKNTPPYNAGYANGEKRKKAENEEPTVVEEEIIYNNEQTEPTKTNNQSTTHQTEPTKTTTQQPMRLERDGVTYETQTIPTSSKVRSYKALG